MIGEAYVWGALSERKGCATGNVGTESTSSLNSTTSLAAKRCACGDKGWCHAPYTSSRGSFIRALNAGGGSAVVVSDNHLYWADSNDVTAVTVSSSSSSLGSASVKESNSGGGGKTKIGGTTGSSSTGNNGAQLIDPAAAPRQCPDFSNVKQVAIGNDFCVLLREVLKQPQYHPPDQRAHNGPGVGNGHSDNHRERDKEPATDEDEGSPVSAVSTEVYSWGEGPQGQLGLGGAHLSTPVPMLVSALKGQKITQISCGNAHAAAVTDYGCIFTWGRGLEGQLGHASRFVADWVNEATDAVQLLPKAVAAFTPTKTRKRPAVAVTCGHNFTIAITRTGEIWAWGEGSVGQLGVGRQSQARAPVLVMKSPDQGTAVPNLSGNGTSQMASKGAPVGKPEHHHDYSRLNSRANSGVGDSTAVPDLFVQVAAGWGHSLARTAGGAVWVWGFNNFGQLGLGDSRTRFTPAVLALPADARAAKVCASGSCSGALTTQGTVLSWGCANEGRLGLISASNALASSSSTSTVRRKVKEPTQHPRTPQPIAFFSSMVVADLALCGRGGVAVVPTRITSIHPSMGPMQGGGLVAVSGWGMWDTEMIVVRFMDARLWHDNTSNSTANDSSNNNNNSSESDNNMEDSVNAGSHAHRRYANNIRSVAGKFQLDRNGKQQIVCKLPPSFGEPSRMVVDVAMDGYTFTGKPVDFAYFKPLEVTGVAPVTSKPPVVTAATSTATVSPSTSTSASATAGECLQIFGANFFPSEHLAVRFTEVPPGNRVVTVKGTVMNIESRGRRRPPRHHISEDGNEVEEDGEVEVEGGGNGNGVGQNHSVEADAAGADCYISCPVPTPPDLVIDASGSLGDKGRPSSGNKGGSRGAGNGISTAATTTTSNNASTSSLGSTSPGRASGAAAAGGGPRNSVGQNVNRKPAGSSVATTSSTGSSNISSKNNRGISSSSASRNGNLPFISEISVTVDGATFSKGNNVIHVLEDATATSCTPTCAPFRGGNVLRIAGRSFFAAERLTARLELLVPARPSSPLRSSSTGIIASGGGSSTTGGSGGGGGGSSPRPRSSITAPAPSWPLKEVRFDTTTGDVVGVLPDTSSGGTATDSKAADGKPMPLARAMQVSVSIDGVNYTTVPQPLVVYSDMEWSVLTPFCPINEDGRVMARIGVLNVEDEGCIQLCTSAKVRWTHKRARMEEVVPLSFSKGAIEVGKFAQEELGKKSVFATCYLPACPDVPPPDEEEGPAAAAAAGGGGDVTAGGVIEVSAGQTDVSKERKGSVGDKDKAVAEAGQAEAVTTKAGRRSSSGEQWLHPSTVTLVGEVSLNGIAYSQGGGKSTATTAPMSLSAPGRKVVQVTYYHQPKVLASFPVSASYSRGDTISLIATSLFDTGRLTVRLRQRDTKDSAREKGPDKQGECEVGGAEGGTAAGARTSITGGGDSMRGYDDRAGSSAGAEDDGYIHIDIDARIRANPADAEGGGGAVLPKKSAAAKAHEHLMQAIATAGCSSERYPMVEFRIPEALPDGFSAGPVVVTFAMDGCSFVKCGPPLELNLKL